MLISLGTAGIVVFQPGLIKHASEIAGFGEQRQTSTRNHYDESEDSPAFQSKGMDTAPDFARNQSYSGHIIPDDSIDAPDIVESHDEYVYTQAPRIELIPETKGVDLIDMPESTIPEYTSIMPLTASVNEVSEIHEHEYSFDEFSHALTQEHEDAHPTDSDADFISHSQPNSDADFSAFNQMLVSDPVPELEVQQPEPRHGEYSSVEAAVPNHSGPIARPPKTADEIVLYDPNSVENRTTSEQIASQTRPIAVPPTNEQPTSSPPQQATNLHSQQPQPIAAQDLPPNITQETQPGRFHIDRNIVEIVPVPGAETLARVGTQVVLGCDVYPETKKRIYVDVMDNLKKLPPEDRAIITDEEIEEQRQKMLSLYFPHILEQQIQTTLLYCDFAQPRKKEEIASVERKIGDSFDNDEIPRLLKMFDAKNKLELNRKLEKEIGSSIDRERSLFVRNYIAYMWMSSQIQEAAGECTHDEMMQYYESHLAEFENKARSKWSQLTVATSNTMPLEEAQKKLIWMANQIISGVSFEEVAMKYSNGPTAKTGGAWDWTGKGVLVSTVLEDAIFQTPVGNLSPIIEDQMGVHIVKVVERVDQSYTPFTEAQTKIREKIKGLRKQKKEAEYLAELRRRFQPEVYITSPSQSDPQQIHIVLPESNGKSLHWHR